MNESEPISSSSDSSTVSLQNEIQSLRTLLLGTLVLVILLSGSLNIYMLRQAGLANVQVVEAKKFLDDYNNNSGPMAREFWIKLTEFGRTHPDINPILSKYSQFVVSNLPPPPAPKK